MASEKIGIYPGTFDPITNGHSDIIGRAARVLDKLVVGVAINPGKGPIFTIDERVSSEEHTSELQSLAYLVCRLLLVDKLLNKLNCRR